jgi:heme-degrading monooxygenase HmoA
MIARIWHGYTNHANADKYETLLKTEIFPGIENKQIKGFKSIQLLRRELDAEVEFITIMQFTSLDDIKAFTGENYETAYVPPSARQVLSRFDDKAQHYEIEEHRVYE